MKNYPPIVQTASFKNVKSDSDSQVRYANKPTPKPMGSCRRVYRFAQYRTRTPEEIAYHQGQILNHPDFDKQMEALALLLGKDAAYGYLSRVLENQKLERVSDAHYELIRE